MWNATTTLLLVILVMSSCSRSDSIPTTNNVQLHFLQVSGKQVPALSLQIFAVYRTTNISCERSLNWLEASGATRPRTVTVEIPIQLLNDKYLANVPLNEFRPGHCGWSPYYVSFAIRAKGEPIETVNSLPDQLKDDTYNNYGINAFYFSIPKEDVGIRVLNYNSHSSPIRIACKQTPGSNSIVPLLQLTTGYDAVLVSQPDEVQQIQVDLVP
jgi:hypothetical protein